MTRIRQLVGGGLISSALVFGLTACHKRAPAVAAAPPPSPPPSTVTAPPPPPPVPPSRPAPRPPAPLTEDQIFAQKSLDQLNAEKPLSDIYFDFDASMIRDDARAPLKKDEEWMRRWTSTHVVIEGHCDDRGTAEYNLALGSHRADAVKQYLASLGIGAGRVTVITKGKEQPICTEETEFCWQQNRRAHFLITAK
jgi:peptidoglycan-associated lipoprotein